MVVCLGAEGKGVKAEPSRNAEQSWILFQMRPANVLS